MAQKTHTSTVTGKTEPCGATKRRCRFAENTGETQATEATEANVLTAIIDKTLTPTPEPIIVPESTLTINAINEYLLWGGVEKEFDSYGPGYSGCNCYKDDYCRCSEYEGLRIEEVTSYTTVLQNFFHTNEIPEDLEDFALDLGIDQKEAYYIETSPGYYGQEADIYLRQDIGDELKRWAYSKDNANDVMGILSYCRSKGLNTVGMNPVEAIKEQLRSEAGGKLTSEVESCESLLKSDQILFNKINIPNKARFRRSTPAEPNSLNGGEAFDGVLLMENGGKKLTLIDGYRRLKAATTKKNGALKGNFMILSNDEYNTLRQISNFCNSNF